MMKEVKTIERSNYEALANRLNGMVLNNNIITLVEDFYLESGTDYNEEEDYYYDIFQYYIISGHDAEYIQRVAPNEIIYYSETLDMYLWGITHYGTPWRGVEIDLIKYDYIFED